MLGAFTKGLTREFYNFELGNQDEVDERIKYDRHAWSSNLHVNE